MGIEQELLPRIFEMFCSGSNLSNGVGMGLYIVNSLVSQAKGKVTIDSDLGEGTSVSLRLTNHSAPPQ